MSKKQYREAKSLDLLKWLLWSGIEDGKAQKSTKSREREQYNCMEEILRRLGEKPDREEIRKAMDSY